MTSRFAEPKGWRKKDFLRYISQRYGHVETGKGFKGTTSERYFEVYYVEYENIIFDITLVGNEYGFEYFDYFATYYFFNDLDLSSAEDGFVEAFNEAMEIAEFEYDDLPHIYASFSVSRISKDINTDFLDAFFDAWETDLMFALLVLNDDKLYGDTSLVSSLATVLGIKYARRSQPILSRSLLQSDTLRNEFVQILRNDAAACPRCGGAGRRRLQFSRCGDCFGSGEIRGLKEHSRQRKAAR